MNNSAASTSTISWNTHVKPALLDITAIAFIYFMPALSHMLGIKLYLMEPMRLMLVLAMVHTNRKNAFLLAVTLPMFSFLVSSHPVFVKTFLISIELVVNVALFFFLVKKMHTLPAIFLSIWLSKIFYYGLKFIALELLLLRGALIGTPLLIQLATSAAFSIYLFMFFRQTEK